MPGTIRRNCIEPGCSEYGVAEYSNRKEIREIERKPWRCVRHTDIESVLSLTNTIREVMYTLSKVENGPEWGGGYAPGLYWLAEGKQHGSGFCYGPGFKAFQEDFPEGTKLTVTAVISVDGELERESE